MRKVALRAGLPIAAAACLLWPPAAIAGDSEFSSDFIDVPSFEADPGPGDPYPSTIDAAFDNGGKVIKHLDVQVFVEHDAPTDVDLLLVGPDGTKVMLMSDAGGTDPFSGALRFDDAAAGGVPSGSTPVDGGVYRPTDVGPGENLPGPAPAGPYGTALSAFNDKTPNGEWRLYAADDTAGNSGFIDGWSIDVEYGNALVGEATGQGADRIASTVVSDPTTLVGAGFQATGQLLDRTPDGWGRRGAGFLFENGATTLGGFPAAGSNDFGVLTTGNARFADDPNSAENTGEDNDGASPTGRGDTAFDVSVLELDVNVPATANCLSLDYRFLSDEFPEFVGTDYNDAFIAEIDQSTWTTSGSLIAAPNDFATHTGGAGVSINGVGPVAVSAAEAEGTTYDAATGLVTTKTPIAPGEHTIYLSIFDQGDARYDSAVLLDNLRFISESAATCQPPKVAETVAPPPPPAGPGTQPPPQPLAPSNHLSVGSKIVFKSGATVLSVKVPGPGVLKAAQAGASASRATTAAKKKKPKALVKPVKIKVKKAGTVKVTIKPTKAGKKVLKRKGKLAVKVRLSFRPTGGTTNSVVKKVTIKRKVAHKGKHH